MKKILATILAWSILTPVFVLSTAAISAADSNMLWGDSSMRDSIKTESGLQNRDPRQTVASVIKVILGFLGIIAVVIILMGGFQYMMAGGDSGKTEEALDKIKSGIIGLIIILSAYGIAIFITNAAYNVTSGT